MCFWGSSERGRCKQGRSEILHFSSKLQLLALVLGGKRRKTKTTKKRKEKKNGKKKKNKEKQRKTKKNKEKQRKTKKGKFPLTPSIPSPLTTSRFSYHEALATNSLALCLEGKPHGLAKRIRTCVLGTL